MPSSARARSGQKQEAGTPSGSPPWMAGAVLGLSHGSGLGSGAAGSQMNTDWESRCCKLQLMCRTMLLACPLLDSLKIICFTQRRKKDSKLPANQTPVWGACGSSDPAHTLSKVPSSCDMVFFETFGGYNHLVILGFVLAVPKAKW